MPRSLAVLAAAGLAALDELALQPTPRPSLLPPNFRDGAPSGGCSLSPITSLAASIRASSSLAVMASSSFRRMSPSRLPLLSLSLM